MKERKVSVWDGMKESENESTRWDERERKWEHKREWKREEKWEYEAEWRE